MEKLVKEKVSTGAYESPGDVVREALRLLEQRDAEILEALRRDIAAASEQFDRGEFTTYSSSRELGEIIKAEARKRLAKQAAKKS